MNCDNYIRHAYVSISVCARVLCDRVQASVLEYCVIERKQARCQHTIFEPFIRASQTTASDICIHIHTIRETLCKFPCDWSEQAGGADIPLDTMHYMLYTMIL